MSAATQRANLHDALERHVFNHAVLCTFTFDPQFFEGYCLDRFKSLAENNNISVLLDRRTYRDLLGVPASEWPRQANIRYLLHPIGVKGTFHPKLFLFASRNKGLLIIGSANFTKAGLTSNAELVGIFRYERGAREQHVGLFRQAMRFLSAVAGRWRSDNLDSNLAEMLADADWLGGETDTPATALRLIDNLERPLRPQIREGSTAPVDAVHVISRYFDATPVALTRVRDECKPQKTVLWTQNGRTTMTRAWFSHPDIVSCRALVRHCEVLDEDREQPLHAKAVALVSRKRVRLAFGSANFTTPGLWSTAANGNVEIMLVADDLPLTAADPRQLFDPSRTATDLREAKDLRPGSRDKLEPHEAREIELIEASLHEQTLTCTCELAASAKSVDVTACFAFFDGGEVHLGLQRAGPSFSRRLDDATAGQCSQGSVVVHLEAIGDGGRLLSSNRVFLVNLQDVESGGSRRSERCIRQAQRSAAGFAAMLAELLKIEDTDPLQTFLTHCDIPIIEAARVSAFRTSRPPWEGDATLRTLGEQNLRAYASLHDAAIGFCDRHMRRMSRLVEQPSVAGVPNFMHIGLAIGNVLGTQVERLLIGLEVRTDPLTIDEWFSHRSRLDGYLTRFRELIRIFCEEYVPALHRRYKAAAVQEALRPDLRPVADLCKAFLVVRDRVDACRHGNLRVQIQIGRLIEPQTFPDDLTGGARWSRWREVVDAGLKQVNDWMRQVA